MQKLERRTLRQMAGVLMGRFGELAHVATRGFFGLKERRHFKLSDANAALQDTAIVEYDADAQALLMAAKPPTGSISKHCSSECSRAHRDRDDV